ncbi:MAG: PAS domain S-box protein [Gemmatimonadaceae bacterium]
MRTLQQIKKTDNLSPLSPLEHLFELSGDVLCIIGQDGNLRRVNAAFTDCLGWTPGAALSRDYLDLVHPDDRDHTRLTMQRRSAHGEPVSDDSRWRCADGSFRWMSWRASAPDRSGSIYVLARDVTRTRNGDAELSTLEEHAGVGIAVVDSETRFVKVNPAFCEMVGYSERELLHMTGMDITHPHDRPVQIDYHRRLALGEIKSYVTEKQYVRKDGSVIWARVTISAVRDACTPIRTFIGVVEDISETKRGTIALAESESRYFRIASNVPGLVYQFRRERDGTASFPFVSLGAKNLYGMSPAELQANPHLMFDAVHPDDREHFYASMAAAARSQSETPWRWTGRITVDDKVKWVEACARPQQLDDGTIVWDGVLRDITEMHDAALQLQSSENRYRSLFQNHPNAVFLLDVDGVFRSANPACSALCGYENDEMLGTAFDPLVVSEHQPTARAELGRALQGSATTYELTILHKSGRRIELSVTNIPVIDDGAVVGVFGIARDLTGQRELEAQFRQAQKMEAVGQLAAGVAHDFNNILTVIHGCSEFLTASLADDDVRREDVDMIRAAATRAALLTRQLLAFSRKQVLQPAIVDLNGCIQELETMLARALGEDVTLELSLANDLAFISADVGQLQQVIVNMAVNARDAMPGGGTLSIATSNTVVDDAFVRLRPDASPGPHVRLSISDTGTGMDDATLARIFEPFFTTKEAGKGTGLGLATAYGIIRQSSGHITVTSAPDSGTTFDIYLPTEDVSSGSVPPEPVTTTATFHDARKRHGGETILLVEDDPAVRCLASQMLTRNGYGVVEAANGAEALDTIRAWNGRVDMVLTDAMMPSMNGGELTEALANEYPAIRVLFMSLYADDDIVNRGPDSRRAFIPKPFTTAGLAAKVREVLDAYCDAA